MTNGVAGQRADHTPRRRGVHLPDT